MKTDNSNKFWKNLALSSQMGRLFWRTSVSFQDLPTLVMNAVLRACLQIYVMQVFPATRMYKINLDLRGKRHSSANHAIRHISAWASFIYTWKHTLTQSYKAKGHTQERSQTSVWFVRKTLLQKIASLSIREHIQDKNFISVQYVIRPSQEMVISPVIREPT